MNKKKIFSPAAGKFKLVSNYKPAGDQPQAIQKLNSLIQTGNAYQTLLGVTGSGKTFTLANIIEKQNRPTLVIAPNKTLAAQLYAEFKDFFPENRVSYFVSYYDYYQPEAYIASTDTYIEKDAMINEEIDKMRHSATRSVLEFRDCIIVASVSCIYGLGAPEDYFNLMLYLEVGQKITRRDLIYSLVNMQYKRSDLEFNRGNFRVRGEVIDIFPSDQDAIATRVLFFGNEIEELSEIDSLTGKTIRKLERTALYPLSHFLTDQEKLQKGLKVIRQELAAWLPELRNKGKMQEAQRLEQRTLCDLELLSEVGFCPGIENYSRPLSGREAGEAPTTLLDYFPDDFLLIIDESHVTIPQLGAMYKGDRSRKQNLVDYGFRLPSALDNRPLNAEEFWQRSGQTVFVSATPGNFELDLSAEAVVEQINRPTGVLDPEIIIKPATNQVDDLLSEIKATVEAGGRVLAITLTKKMSEDLSSYLQEVGIRCRYLHSEIKTIERVEILHGLRKGDFDVLIGINLLREGLDLVEVSLVAVLDADKEGFLRSARSLIQIMGRAARNVSGRVVLYADQITGSIQEALNETERRRKIRIEFNKQNKITPASAKGALKEVLSNETELIENEFKFKDQTIDLPKDPSQQRALIEKLKKDMYSAAAKYEFEKAAEIRDLLNFITEAIVRLA